MVRSQPSWVLFVHPRQISSCHGFLIATVVIVTRASLLLNIPFSTAVLCYREGRCSCVWSLRILWSHCPSCTSVPCSDSAGTTGHELRQLRQQDKKKRFSIAGPMDTGPDGGSLSRTEENIPDLARSMATRTKGAREKEITHRGPTA